MTKRNLLICFDAFGTLFKPKRPVEEQYTTIARRHFGLRGFDASDVRASFRKAFKASAETHPNFGKEVGMGATWWWTNVINNTFQPLMPDKAIVPPGLAPALLHRFSSSEGYTVPAPGLRTLLQTLKSRDMCQKQFDQIVVGVVTNSDDRVPLILESFGLKVSPLRFGSPPRSVIKDKEYDVDFHCISYDVGAEKPDRRIFDAAEEMARTVCRARNRQAAAAGVDDKWLKLFVGDELATDVVGALGAGWHSVFLVQQQGKIMDDANIMDEVAEQFYGRARCMVDLDQIYHDEKEERAVADVFPVDGKPVSARTSSLWAFVWWFAADGKRAHMWH
ncbi:hypothetical protein B0H66DRAFT_547307 [Apodospora peruviana]|uniref:Haloacid dehalogenase n=1 Tax=Apodospora peruviana TaxID=516989 RepID=A0AAE0IHK0_9PEZI|nr:hypothetical protein B0H66DRAFT_547307 [Apodospora peruviana]